ncbi:MAG TPA: MBL fold metallo-hydrolase [Pyrinomonadaceae bacterium]|nr:MBL fold metallo-hydrolase [Pyrinomonadaceae bacterium]
MNSRIGSIAPLFVLLLVTSLSPLTVHAQRRTVASGSLRSYAQAQKTLEAGITALGGLQAIRDAKDVSARISGYSYARNQSLHVNAPYDKMSREENLYIDVANRKYIIETRDPLPGGFVFGGKQVIVGNQGFFVNPRDKTVSPLNLANFNNIGLLRRFPHLLLIAAYETAASTLRWRGQEMYAGKLHNVISFASNNGIVWTLFFDARTNLLSKYEQMVSDSIAGDSIQETIFPGYRSVGALKVPTKRITKRAGELTEEVDYKDVQFNTRPGDAAFAKPDGLDELPQFTPPPTKETKLADGVYLFESGANSLVVEFADYVMVIEPYAGGRGAKPTINKVREMFPQKQLKYVVITHHHDDHSGGLRGYIAEGVTIVTTAANQKYFEKMAASNFTINRDDQTTNKKKPVFQFIKNEKSLFDDGNQVMEIIDIGPSPHAKEMLIAYLPKHKLVFQGDLVNLPNTGKYMPTTVNVSTIHFFDMVKRLGLDVDRVAAVHGPTTSWDDLRKAVEKTRVGR